MADKVLSSGIEKALLSNNAVHDSRMNTALRAQKHGEGTLGNDYCSITWYLVSDGP